jgi:hypothetical protein
VDRRMGTPSWLAPVAEVKVRPIWSVSIDQFGTGMIMWEPPTNGLSVKQIQIVPHRVIIDVASDGRTVGVEILDPKIIKRFFSPAMRKLFKAYKIKGNYSKSLDIKR